MKRFKISATKVSASSIRTVTLDPPVSSRTLLDTVAIKEPPMTVKVIKAILVEKYFMPKKEEVKAEEAVQTTIFRDDEIEKVEVVKKKKERKNPFKVTWTKFIEKADDLYKSLNEDIDKENI